MLNFTSDCPTYVPPVNGPNDFRRRERMADNSGKSGDHRRKETDSGWDRVRQSPEYRKGEGGSETHRRQRSRDRSRDRPKRREEKRQRVS
jgi:hypothetical protein